MAVAITPWPYITKDHHNGSSTRHFCVSKDRFATEEDALNTAIREARKRIDDGFDPTQM
jgi:hypothetical protein